MCKYYRKQEDAINYIFSYKKIYITAQKCRFHEMPKW